MSNKATVDPLALMMENFDKLITLKNSSTKNDSFALLLENFPTHSQSPTTSMLNRSSSNKEMNALEVETVDQGDYGSDEEVLVTFTFV